MHTVIPVILAGGQGTRLWPASLPDIPKQFLTIGDTSLIQQAIERAIAISHHDILIVTHEKYLNLFSEKLHLNKKDASRIHILGEPKSKNTTAAITLANIYAQQHFKNPILLVMTADHIISPIHAFTKDVIDAIECAKHNYIVTFGISPTHAETGYGYIEYSTSFFSEGGENIKQVISFHEKPSKELAQRYIKEHHFLWNSGMFCFNALFMKTELEKYCPTLIKVLSSHSLTWQKKDNTPFLQVIPSGIDYSSLENISIDYAVMEHTQRSAVLLSSFDWNDLGNWEEVSHFKNKTEETSPSHIYLTNSERVNVFSPIPVGVCGLSDIIVIVENNRVLVMKKGYGQDVKLISEKDALQSKKNL